MTGIPDYVANEECLHRRVHPTFVKNDGKVSSQAFTGDELSVDRGHYRDTEDTLLNHEGYGIVGFYAEYARQLDQEVISDPLTTNLAHALVNGKKTNSVRKRFAKKSSWVVPIKKP
jgi:hypothetical protein